MTLDTVDPHSGKITNIDVPISEASPAHVVRLRAVAGASALQIRLREGGSLVFDGEVGLSPGETIEVSLKGSPIGAECGARPVFRLNSSQYSDSIILPPCDSKSADIVFLVDGTSRGEYPGQDDVRRSDSM